MKLMIKETITKANVQGIIAVILIVGGLYILGFNNSSSDIKIAIVGLMSTVAGYYFGSSKQNTLKNDAP